MQMAKEKEEEEGKEMDGFTQLNRSTVLWSQICQQVKAQFLPILK